MLSTTVLYSITARTHARAVSQSQGPEPDNKKICSTTWRGGESKTQLKETGKQRRKADTVAAKDLTWISSVRGSRCVQSDR